MSRELSDLVTRHGGRPHAVPAVREALFAPSDEVEGFLDRLCGGTCTLVIFLTGVGVTALLREAERLGRFAVRSAIWRSMACNSRSPARRTSWHGCPPASRTRRKTAISASENPNCWA